MDTLTRHHVLETGNADGPTVLFAHGLGGTQRQWDQIVQTLAPRARCITFALAGSPGAAPSAFSPSRHSTLFGFADDIAAICGELDAEELVFVGHSMSGSAGAIAATADPTLFQRVVLLNSSACYVDHPAEAYIGGFTAEQVDALLGAIASDFTRWASGFGSLLMGEQTDPSFADEFTETLRQYPPEVASVVFRTAFRSDLRELIPQVPPPVLVLQSRQDPAVPVAAAEWLAANLPTGTLHTLMTPGHFPHVVAPGEVCAALSPFLFPETL